MGKKPGSQEEAASVVCGDISSSPVESVSVPLGLGLVGRSGWSVGVAVGSSPVLMKPGGGVTTVGGIVVVWMTSWSSSSSSVGMGRSVASLGSMLSPHSFRWKSVQVPLCSFGFVSLTITVHVPCPDSPLLRAEVSGVQIATSAGPRSYLPVHNTHESPVFVA